MRAERMRAESNGIGIEYELTGEGRPVILLHGFPDTGRLWRHQVPALSEAGFKVIVPDLRGYGGSDKPDEVDAYRMHHLVADVVAVLDDAGAPRAHVVGHDWGAALAWAVAGGVPDRVDHLVALSVGHPTAFRTAGFEQYARSWYMLLFQFRGVSETFLSASDWAGFRKWAGHPDVDGVVADLKRDGSLTPGLNYYRANVPPELFVGGATSLPAIPAPTMGVWSSGDFALTEAQMKDSEQYVSGPWRFERIEGVGHWMQLEAPEEVNRLLLDFLPV
jgi:pimeloyl-ACP methyl ester carboxylesterase